MSSTDAGSVQAGRATARAATARRAAAFVVVLALVAGCAGVDDPTKSAVVHGVLLIGASDPEPAPPPGGAPGARPAPAAPPAPPPQEAVVFLVDETPDVAPDPQRKPRGASLLVDSEGRFPFGIAAGQSGGTLQITNGGRHSVEVTLLPPGRGKATDMGTLAPGETRSAALRATGPHRVVARRDRDESLTWLLVLEGPDFAVARPGGAWRMDGAVPGRKYVAAWAPGWSGRSPERAFDLPGGSVVPQDVTLRPARPAALFAR